MIQNQQQTSRIPQFRSREEEAQWWDTHDITDYLDELEPIDVHFDLEKPQEDTVVFRLHKGVKRYLERLAKSKGLNMSSLLRMWVMEKVKTAHQ